MAHRRVESTVPSTRSSVVSVPEYMLWGIKKHGQVNELPRSSLDSRGWGVRMWGTEGGAGGQLQHRSGERVDKHKG